MTKRIYIALLAFAVVALGVAYGISRAETKSVDHQAVLEQAFSNARQYTSFQQTTSIGSEAQIRVFRPDSTEMIYRYASDSSVNGTQVPADEVDLAASLDSNSLYVKVSSDAARVTLEAMTNVKIGAMAPNTWYYVPTADHRFGPIGAGLDTHTSSSEYFQLGSWKDKMNLTWTTFGEKATYLDTVTKKGVRYARYSVTMNQQAADRTATPTLAPATLWITTGSHPLPYGWTGNSGNTLASYSGWSSDGAVGALSIPVSSPALPN